jgi:hypothetical protein
MINGHRSGTLKEDKNGNTVKEHWERKVKSPHILFKKFYYLKS